MQDSTIVAVATPPGRGGIGVVRLSGPSALSIAGALSVRSDPLEPRRATLVPLIGPAGEAIDRGIVTAFPAPHSYTGEHVVELSVHGSPVVLEALVRAAVAHGARLANPGEFTLRAYLNGRIDLLQAEAVADLTAAATPLQARLAYDQLEGTLTARIREIDAPLFDLIVRLEASVDFPDEGYHFITPAETARTLGEALDGLDAMLEQAAHGRLIREGCTVAIVGRPNVGKSSLFNRLVGSARAIVTEVPGTTRDLVTERVDLDGVPFTFVDTAGVRETAADAVEREGIDRARQAGAAAELLVVVLDRSMPIGDEDAAVLGATGASRRIVVGNKSDRPCSWDVESLEGVDVRPVSASTGAGVAELRERLIAAAGGRPLREAGGIVNARHASLMKDARAAVVRAREAATAGLSEEFVLADLHAARACFDEVTGVRTPADVLQAIFSRFCIGK